MNPKEWVKITTVQQLNFMPVRGAQMRWGPNDTRARHIQVSGAPGNFWFDACDDGGAQGIEQSHIDEWGLEVLMDLPLTEEEKAAEMEAHEEAGMLDRFTEALMSLAILYDVEIEITPGGFTFRHGKTTSGAIVAFGAEAKGFKFSDGTSWPIPDSPGWQRMFMKDRIRALAGAIESLEERRSAGQDGELPF